MNAHGLRGPEFTNKKPEGVRRVVFLGDSNTFGMGADRYDNYPHRLGRWLSYSAGKRWEVINAAIPGYSAFQMLQMLRTRAKDYAPDVVVVYPGAWNDYTPAIQYDDATAHEVIEAAKAARTGLSVKRLRVYELLAQSMKHTASAASSDGKAQKYRKLWSDAAQRPDGPRLSQQKFREVLTAIARESKALGAKVIFIVPPAPPRRARSSSRGISMRRSLGKWDRRRPTSASMRARSSPSPRNTIPNYSAITSTLLGSATRS